MSQLSVSKAKLDSSTGKTLVMGVLNVTPDSFSDEGKFFDTDKALSRAKQMIEEGADIIDVGGESTRPGSDPVSVEEELKRVIPVIEKLSKLNIPVSIDSYKPEVVKKALQAGAAIINDITGLSNPEMVKLAKEFNVPVIVMHMKGLPKTMQENPVYKDVVKEIKSFFQEKIALAKKEEIGIILDPGIGFGKTTEHNLQILKNLKEFTSLGKPLLIGTSRKSFIGNVLNLPVNERLEGSLVTAALSSFLGAKMIRVHDVKESKRALQIVDAIKGA